MKVYFTASIVGKKDYLKNYEKIIEIVQKKHDIKFEHILHHTEQKISLETRQDRLDFHRKLHSWIQDCDCMIVEGSFPSISVGYEIAIALRLGKPVLLLYSQGHAPSLLDTYRNEKIMCEKYTFDTITVLIEDFLNYVQGNSDSRFTFYITPEIALYLDRITIEKKLPKSVYIRKLIEEDMRKNNE